MLCQLRYAVRSVRVCDISVWSGIVFKLARFGYTLRVTSQVSHYSSICLMLASLLKTKFYIPYSYLLSRVLIFACSMSDVCVATENKVLIYLTRTYTFART